MTNPRDALPSAVTMIEAGMADGLHIGAQVYVSRDGETIADFALGEARRGVPMTTDSMMIWWSSSKPIAAVAIGRLWEQGKVDIEAPVIDYIPEFGSHGKDDITVRHVLTHTGGFRYADGRDVFVKPWEAMIAKICDAKLDDGWVPGEKAGYHPSSGWFILGEIVRRVDGRPFEQYVRDEIFLPLGMSDCWIGMPPERYREYGDRIGIMHNTESGEATPVQVIDTEEGCARCVPAAGGRGPMRELGRFYEALLNNGQLGETRILSPQTVQAMTARHRIGMFDETFQMPIDWGLGFLTDSILFGRHNSPRSFGHGGMRSSVGFADPESRLVIAAVFNGMTDAGNYYRRSSRVCSAIYQDLGLAKEDSPGRERSQPKTGLT